MTLPLSTFIDAIDQTLQNHADEVAELDQAIGDGDHLINLQRGIDALQKQADALDKMDLSAGLGKIGMTLMSTMGGASGSLFGSMFVSMGKQAKTENTDLAGLTATFEAGVASVKARGKADIGEKTMLDTLIPAVQALREAVDARQSPDEALTAMQTAAEEGMKSTCEMQATKGRASFLGERAIGHIDAGARTSQLMLDTIVEILQERD